jgi:hypothetical protein
MRISGLLLLIMLVSSACNLSRTEVSSLPTASTVEATAVNATRTPILYANEVHPTQLITSGAPSATLPPPPLPVAIPTQMSTANVNINPSTTPDQAVKNYYTLVSQGRYDLGWSMLTDAFKQKFNCCAPNYNYTDYVKWWDSVNTVEFGNVKTVSQNGDHAVVYAEFYYVMNTGAKSSLVGDPYIALVYDPTLNTWRFDDKRATP